MNYMSYRNIPILLLDIKGFSSRSRIEQQNVKKSFKDILIKASKFFLPYTNIFESYPYQDTGDGYYIALINITEQIALKYVLNIDSLIAEENKTASPGMQIRLRIALVTGNLDIVEGEHQSDEYILANRIADWSGLRSVLTEHPEVNTAIACSTVFYDRLNKNIRIRKEFEDIEKKWILCKGAGKDNFLFDCYLEGDFVPPSQDTQTTPDTVPTPAFRITILIGNDTYQNMKEALEFAKVAVQDLEKSNLNICLRVDKATKSNLVREMKRGIDLLIYYGHGSEEGQLQFEDGTYSFNQLLEKEKWSELTGFIGFACYGEKFAQNLPCAWLAFTESIMKDAPKSYMRALIGFLQTNAMDEAIELARNAVKEEMQNNLPDCLEISQKPWDKLFLPKGTPELQRYSPVLKGHYHTDFLDACLEATVLYPEDDPFVGREAELKILQDIPSPLAGTDERKVYWVWGNPGMGKSAFLRQYVSWVRDYYFHNADQPLYIFQMNCWGYPAESNLIEDMCVKLAKLYKLEIENPSVEDIMKEISRLKVRHIWVLDDLTDLDADKVKTEKAEKLITRLKEQAQVEAVSLTLITSTRIKSNSGQQIQIKELSEDDASKIAMRVWAAKHEKNPGYREFYDALNLFEKTGKVTGIYRRSLILALEAGLSFTDYALSIGKLGSMDTINYFEFTQKLMAKEIECLDKSAGKYGFNFRSFLESCYSLIDRVAYFSLTELQEWFNDEFKHPNWIYDTLTAYDNGLMMLCNIGFLTHTEEPGVEDSYYTIPPNQREVIRSIQNHTLKLQEGLPVRAPQARIAMAMEAGKSIGFAALPLFNSIESDYQFNHQTPEALRAYLIALGAKADFLDATKQRKKQIETYQRVIALGTGHQEAEIAELVTITMRNWGVVLNEAGQRDEEIRTYRNVIALYQHREEVRIVEQVACTMYNLGIVLGETGQQEEEIKTYREVISHYQHREEAAIAKQVAQVMGALSLVLCKMGQLEESYKIYNDVIDRYQYREEAGIAEHVATTIINWGVFLGEAGQLEEAIKAYRTVIALYQHREEFRIAEKVVCAMFYMGNSLVNAWQQDEGIKNYRNLISLYQDRKETRITETVASAMYNLGNTLREIGQKKEAIKAYRSVITLYQHREESGITKQVAISMYDLGVALFQNGQMDEGIKIFVGLIERYQHRKEESIIEIVKMTKSLFVESEKE